MPNVIGTVMSTVAVVHICAPQSQTNFCMLSMQTQHYLQSLAVSKGQ